MASSLSIDDRAFRSALAAETKKMERDASRRLETLGEQTADAARQRCPVRTGKLRASIKASFTTTADGAEVEVAATEDYAAYVEFGTSDTPSRPFLRPALAEAPRRWVR